ncbi:hypothetical protein OG440_38395 (plasmid) [Streptomyces sp. NBC_00637]|jgi:hypothetical protein|uniref:hypothetical protein n=1 Tax=Streptomyces sp. NBC_00637 TaxID=2903667 RepID=UPI002F90F5B6
MGYTHRFAFAPQAPSFRTVRLQLALDAGAIVRLVERTQEIRIAGGSGAGAPRISEDAIVFNGLAELDQEYETFAIDMDARQPGVVTSFCKTGSTSGRPYDIAVTAVLLRAHTLAPRAFAIDSDGRWDEDWVYARAIHKMLFADPGMQCPFTPSLTVPEPLSAPM